MCRCSIQPVSLHEVRENNGRAGLVRTALYSRNVRAVPQSMTISCAERVGEKACGPPSTGCPRGGGGYS